MHWPIQPSYPWKCLKQFCRGHMAIRASWINYLFSDFLNISYSWCVFFFRLDKCVCLLKLFFTYFIFLRLCFDIILAFFPQSVCRPLSGEVSPWAKVCWHRQCTEWCTQQPTAAQLHLPGWWGAPHRSWESATVAGAITAFLSSAVCKHQYQRGLFHVQQHLAPHTSNPAPVSQCYQQTARSETHRKRESGKGHGNTAASCKWLFYNSVKVLISRWVCTGCAE